MGPNGRGSAIAGARLAEYAELAARHSYVGDKWQSHGRCERPAA